MARVFSFNLPRIWRKGCRHFLAFAFLAGLIAGMTSGVAAGDSLDSWMRGAAYSSVSITGLLCVSVLPFLFSAFAVYLSRPKLLPAVAFGKAFLLSFVGLLVMRVWGNAGWLVRLLLCFSSCTQIPVLYFYWLRHISGERGFSAGEAAGLFALSLLIGSVDYFCVAPLLARLIF